MPDQIHMNGALRPMLHTDLPMVRAWRNHPNVRQYMYNAHEITENEHAQWFEKSVTNKDRHLLIFMLQGIALGFVNITQTAPGGIADWGFYLAPDAPKGSGQILGRAALAHAFTTLHFHKVCGQVLSANTKSVLFHQRLGFQQEGLLHEQHYDGIHYHDVIHFGLLHHLWQATL